MPEEIGFSPEDQQFINRAVNFCQQMGKRAVLMLIGSRAAGFTDEWSDLDLCIIGDKRRLSDEDRRTYEQSWQLFVDRGDYEAHWSFFDEGDLREWLESYPDEMMWVVSTSQTLYGCSRTAEALKRDYCLHPPAIAESKLKWMFGKYYFSQRGPLAMAARNRVETSFIAVGNVIEYLCKMCCVAERHPYPYEKWLVEVAKQTRLGAMVYPMIQRAVSGLGVFLEPPSYSNWRDWAPVKELRGTLPIVQRGLKEIGWTCDWIDDPNGAYFDETARRPAP
ncbi:MAG: nucleotidyltransferase domain-containing protein [Candidatus Poribacteria bacterium]|nr:nucleotidyltransferase domain-containing protein [Candidatus Poribacteria bacterium]